MRISDWSSDVCSSDLSPLHNPVRLAEDAATLSLLSAGRFDLGVGQGYWAREFEAFGRKVTHRPSLLEGGVEIIRQAWRAEARRVGKSVSVRVDLGGSRCNQK